MIDKKYIRFLVLTVCAVFFCISLHISSSADSFYDDDGYLTFENSSYNSSFAFYSPFSSPVVPQDFSGIPSGYVLCAYSVNSSESRCRWYYFPSTYNPMYCYQNSSGSIYIGQSSSGVSGFYITNDISNNGTLSYLTSGSFRSYSITLNTRLTAFIPCIDSDGNITRPVSLVNFTLNTAFINDRLVFNSSINSGDASSVSYYMFPASAPISGGNTSTIISPTPQNQLTTQQLENFLLRGFKIVSYGIDDLIIDLTSPDVSLSVSSSTRSSNVFNPDSYNVSYEYLGSGRLYSSGDTSITPSGSISIKDILGNHSGVYAYQQLKLVAVCSYENRSFIATFDFNPSAINGGAPVAPSTLEPSVSYPIFSNSQSDFKELADYLKNLYETQNTNDKRNMNNLLAMLNNFPWSAKLAPAFKAGFDSSLPELSDELDTIFGGIFEEYTKPSDDDIQDLLDDITEERENIEEKFVWVNDVKIEVYYICDSILHSGSIPPDFYVTIQGNTFWRIEQPFVLTFLDCSRIPLNVVNQIKNLITVFLTLSVVLYIWRTLPSTIGNVPKGD